MQLFNLTGKTALVTGASSGLGARFSQCLSDAGARVIMAARRVDQLQELSKKINNSLVLQMDVAEMDSVHEAFLTLEANHEHIDICINNAGIAKETSIFERDKNRTFESIIQTNLMGVWYVTKTVAKHMKNKGIKGSIINIGSVNGDAIPATQGAAYSASKAAVIHLTKTLVGELSPHKIRINCISPGWFTTPMNGPEIEKIISKIPLGKIGNPNDLDGLILYLSSNEASSYVTGSCFTIDGGVSWGGISW